MCCIYFTFSPQHCLEALPLTPFLHSNEECMIYKENLEITIDASKYNLHMSENARNLCFIRL